MNPSLYILLLVNCTDYYLSFRLNLSGIPYDYSQLDNKVLEFPFMDHHPPPLELLQQIIQVRLDKKQMNDPLPLLTVGSLSIYGPLQQISSLRFFWQREYCSHEIMPAGTASSLPSSSNQFATSLSAIFLNPDIALLILNRLCVKDLIRIRIVSKRWKQLVSRASVSLSAVKDPEIRDYDSSDEDSDDREARSEEEKQQTLYRIFPLATSFTTSFLLPPHHKAFFPRFPNLTRLVLRCPKALSSIPYKKLTEIQYLGTEPYEALFRTLSKLPHLQHLDLRCASLDTTLLASSASLRKLTSLTSIRSQPALLIGLTVGPTCALKALTNLTSVSLPLGSWVSLCAQSLKQLHTLETSEYRHGGHFTPIDQSDIDCLVRLSGLRSLSIEFARDKGDLTFSALTHLHQLHITVPVLTNASPFASLTQLRKLSLLTPPVLLRHLPNPWEGFPFFPLLEELRLTGGHCPPSLFSLMPKLSSLSLHMVSVTVDSTSALLRTLK